MPCPRCGEPLVAREADGTSYHACGAHGDYVSHDALRRALPFAAHSALEEARERATPGPWMLFLREHTEQGIVPGIAKTIMIG